MMSVEGRCWMGRSRRPEERRLEETWFDMSPELDMMAQSRG
jgi:hypothetical protein